jgi:PAS domain S-box-containing protein
LPGSRLWDEGLHASRPRGLLMATGPPAEMPEIGDRRLLDDLPNGFALHEMIFDRAGRPADFRFLYVNAAFERLTGLRAADVLGKTALEVLPGIESHWIESFGRVVSTGESVRFERHFGPLHRDYDVTAYQAGEGRFASLFTDITETRRAESARLESERRFQTILDSIPDLVWSKDRESRIIVANEPYCRLSGRKPEELVGK